MPSKEKSKVFEFIKNTADQWDNIIINVFQDGNWQKLPLSKVKNDRAIADHIVTRLQEKQFGSR
jgi:hypothetical protein